MGCFSNLGSAGWMTGSGKLGMNLNLGGRRRVLIYSNSVCRCVEAKVMKVVLCLEKNMTVLRAVANKA